MSYEDVVKSLKVLATLSLGTYSGAAVYSMVAVQPSLIQEKNVPAASSVMNSLLKKSAMMPISGLLASLSSIALHYKLRGTSQEDQFWLLSGSLILAMNPYTIYYIGPINSKFRFAEESEFSCDEETWSERLSDWLFYHRPRALFCAGLFGITVYKLVK